MLPVFTYSDLIFFDLGSITSFKIETPLSKKSSERNAVAAISRLLKYESCEGSRNSSPISL